jgi:GxxExxY protein
VHGVPFLSGLVNFDTHDDTNGRGTPSACALTRFFLAFLASLRETKLLDITENAVAKQVVDAAYRVHSVLGPGLLESVYQAVMASELQKRGLSVAQQQVIPVVYDDTRFEMGFRADLVVQNSVIVELKSIAEITALHKKQLLTYLRLADKRLGLLINFNVALIKDGITRIVNGLQE